jgi:hypothetical protein
MRGNDGGKDAEIAELDDCEFEDRNPDFESEPAGPPEDARDEGP